MLLRYEKIVAKKLSKLSKKKSEVFRNGLWASFKPEELLPGDLVLIRDTADIVADIRILWISPNEECKVDNVSLTGEADPLLRSALRETDEWCLPIEAKNLLFMGTKLKQGSLLGVVVKTGHDSLMGSIAALAVIILINFIHMRGYSTEDFKENSKV